MNPSAKILIVDDDLDLLRATRRILESASYQVTSAQDATQALAQAHTHYPDLILLDVNLPDMSGIEVCRQIKQDPELKNTCVVMLSASKTDSESQAQGLEAGADGYIARPIGNHELVARVQSILRLQAAELAGQRAQAETQRLLEQSEKSRRALLSILEDRRRAEETLRKQNQILIALQNTTLELVSQLDLKTLLENIVKRAGALVGTSAGFIDLVDPATNQLIPHVGVGALEESLHLPVQPGEGLTGTVWQTGEMLIIPDYDEWAGRLGKFSPKTLSSVIGVPLLSEAKVIGVLGLGSAYGSPHYFDPASIEVLNQFARLATVAVQNARLFSNLQAELSERKRAEQALRESEEMLQSIFVSTPDPITVVDLNGVIKLCNQSTADVHGYASAEQLIGKYFMELIAKEDHPRAIDGMMQVLAEGIVKDAPFIGLKGNGDKFTGELSVSAIKDATGDPSGFVGITKDITERNRAQEAISQRNAELTALNQIGQALSKLAQPSEIFELIFTVIGQIADNRNVFIAMYDPDRRQIAFPMYTMNGQRVQGRERPLGNGITDYIIRTNTPFLVKRDLASALSQHGIELIGTLSRSFLGVPIHTDGEVIGVIALQDYENENVYNEHHLELLTTIAAQASSALKNARLYSAVQQELEERKRTEAALQASEQTARRTAGQLQMVNQMGTAITSGLDFEQMTQTLYGQCQRIGDTHTFFVALYDNATGTIRYPFYVKDGERRTLSPSIIRGKAIIGQYIVEHPQMLYIPDSFDWPPQLPPIVRQPGTPTRAQIWIPLIVGDKIVGLFSVQSHAPNAYSPEQIQTLELLATQVAIAIQNSQLYEQVQQELVERKRTEELLLVRMRLMEFGETHTLDQLLQKTLDEVEVLTQSRIGFYHFVESDQTTLSLQAWSTRTEKEFCTAQGKGTHYNIAEAGVWVDCVYQRRPVIHNDYASLPASRRKGLPEGHAQVVRELVVPILRNDLIVAILGVGNKPSDYDEKDTSIVAYLADVVWEIAERKRTEQALVEGEARFRAVVQTANDAIITMNTQGNIVSWNTAAETIFGFSKDEMLGAPVNRIVPEQFQEYQRISMDRVLASNDRKIVGTTIQVAGLAKDGRQFPIEMSLAEWQTHSGNFFTAIIRDVSERKQAEERVLQSEKKYRELFQVNKDGIAVFMLNPDGSPSHFVEFNTAAHTMLGYTPEEMRHLTPMMLEPFVTPTQVQSRQAEFQSTGVTNFETILQHKNGQPVYAEFTSQIIQYENQHAVMNIVRDVTERKQHEKELRAIATLSAALRSAPTRAEMLPVIIEQMVALLNCQTAAIEMIDPLTGDSITEAAHGTWQSLIGARQKSDTGINALIRQTRRPYFTNDLKNDPNLAYREWVRQDIRGGIGTPLIAQDQLIGFMWIGRTTDVSESDVRLLAAVADMAANALHRATLHEQTKKDATDLALAYDTTLEGWAHALELRDQETEGHTRRVVQMTLDLARALGIGEDELENVRRGALLHDIGKMGIPDSVLLKPGTLNDREWEIMRQHPEYAYQLLQPIDYLHPAIDIPYCHHEQWDGSGYPRGLQGEEIPLQARIFAIVDVWDALTSDRPYRKAWSASKARQHIQALSGKHFDPRVVAAFLEMTTQR